MPPVECREGFGGEPSYAAVFARALLDPDLATPAVVAGPKSKAADKRYNVYRNNVTVSLINALAVAFPATQRITGVDFFRAMARFYVRAAPPLSPLLFEYGRDFTAHAARLSFDPAGAAGRYRFETPSRDAGRPVTLPGGHYIHC